MRDRYAARFAAKWPEDVANRGFAALPKCIVTCAGDLGLKPLEVLVLCNIVEKCWKEDDKAFFGVEYIATNVGRGKSTVIETTNSLVQKGYIAKTRRFNHTNLYGLEPCQTKLNEHMEHCRRWWKSRKPNPDVQKSGVPNSQKTSTYIEPELIRNPDIESINNSRHFNNEADDQLLSDDNHGLCFANPTGDRHEWREYEVENYKGEELITRYYFTCTHCGAQYHKDGERPWPAEYPPLNSQFL